VLATAEPPPFAVDDRTDADEPIRSRTASSNPPPRMQANLRLRATVNSAIRPHERQGFCEVETRSCGPTPRAPGVRVRAAPPGSFYVLPQARSSPSSCSWSGDGPLLPDARCMRDEDLRADRQFEFTQLDMERHS